MSTIFKRKYFASLDFEYSINTLTINAMDCCRFSLGFVNKADTTQALQCKHILDVSISVFMESIIACWNLKLNNDLFDFIISSYFWGLLNYQRYPYNPDVTNQVFDQVIENKRSHTYSTGNNAVKIFNIQAGGSDDVVTEYLTEIAHDTSRTLLYHGTNHAGAQAILENGIDLTKGTPNNFLSHKDGFYLTDSYHRAWAWGKHDKQSTRPAVLVFRVDNAMMDTEVKHGLDVSDDRNEDHVTMYQKIYDLCKAGYLNVVPNFKKKAIQDFNFIKAPFKKPNEKSNKKLIQICIRKENYADEFSSLNNICCVVFY